MITARILQRIKSKGRGAIFAPSDLLDLGSRASVDQTLSRLADQGVIRRLTRGLYDYPKISPRFGMIQPSVDDVARAIARKDRYVLLVSQAAAANQFGLSTQVPSKPVYMTDGPTRTRSVGRQTIQFRNASRKTLTGAGQTSGAVFQALRYVGKDGVTDSVINKLARTLSDKDRDLLAKQSRDVPAWMQPVIQQITAHV
jgi:predicted transcriptional regulator of viral defense system